MRIIPSRRLAFAGLAAIVALAAASAALAAGGGHAKHAKHAKRGTVVKLRRTDLGKVLVDSRGLTLYLFVPDTRNRSTCYGKCASFWPPLLTTGKPRAGAGAKASLLATTKRKDGKLQVTYAGHPLYRFKLDKKPGRTAGQGQDFFGGAWYVLSSRGKKIVKAAETQPPASSSDSSATTTTTPAGNGYSYGNGY